MKVIPYGKTDRTVLKEFDVYGQHFVYQEIFKGAAGLAFVNAGGGATTSSLNHYQFLRIPGREPANLLDLMVVVQSDGSTKKCVLSKVETPWHQIYYLGNKLYGVVSISPRNATDIPIKLRYPTQAKNIQFIGEWDPELMKFKLDKYFADEWDEPYLRGRSLEEKDLNKAVLLLVRQ